MRSYKYDLLRFQKSFQKTPVSQKKRFILKRQGYGFIFFGSAAFFFLHQAQFEFVYLRLVRRRLRIMLKKKGNRYKNRRIWLNLKANFPISKKAKNSRMGKGKGAFVRWVAIIAPFSVFFSFFGVSFYLLKKLIRRLNYLFKSRLFLVSRLVSRVLWAKKHYTKVATSQWKLE